MSDIVLATKGYVDGKDCKEYMDIAFNSDMYTKEQTALPMIFRDETNIWIIPGETLELTHVMLHYFKNDKKDFDNVYIGICPTSFTSGIPWAVTETPLQITAGETVMDIWLKLTTPFRISEETEGWTGWCSGVITPGNGGTAYILEKTSDGYKALDGVKPMVDYTSKYWNLKSYDDPETIFITNGTKHTPGGEMRGRFYPRAGMYPNQYAMQSLRYKIYKNSNNPTALASKEYTDTKMN